MQQNEYNLLSDEVNWVQCLASTYWRQSLATFCKNMSIVH